MRPYNRAWRSRSTSRRRRSPSPPARSSPASGRRVGFDRGEGYERLWIGQAVHRRVLGENLEKFPGYAVEKAVRLTFPVDDFTAVLEGRLDGRWEDGGRVVVDEVKSLHFAEDLARLPGSPRLERFQLQLRWYMHAVAAAEGRAVAGRLILADIETGATKILEVAHEPDKTLAGPRPTHAGPPRRVPRGARARRGEGGRGRDARLSARDVPPRPARDGGRGRARRRAGRAPPRRGARRASARPPPPCSRSSRARSRPDRRLYVLTAKTTQQEIYEKTLGLVEGDSFRSVRLRAKERMCANDVVLCHEDHCPYAKDYGAKMEASGLLERLLETAPPPRRRTPSSRRRAPRPSARSRSRSSSPSGRTS